jgi:hypothetical protein
MSKVRPCGCTYRTIAELYVSDEQATETAAELLAYMLGSGGRTWGHLCTLMRANTDEKRDRLHHVLHMIATPIVTPESGPGRRGTTWHLRQDG